MSQFSQNGRNKISYICKVVQCLCIPNERFSFYKYEQTDKDIFRLLLCHYISIYSVEKFWFFGIVFWLSIYMLSANHHSQILQPTASVKKFEVQNLIIVSVIYIVFIMKTYCIVRNCNSNSEKDSQISIELW